MCVSVCVCVCVWGGGGGVGEWVRVSDSQKLCCVYIYRQCSVTYLQREICEHPASRLFYLSFKFCAFSFCALHFRSLIPWIQTSSSCFDFHN